tara:strand:+ start:3025 stop:4026 length:1002 start_codon:yes stop_codon:yes gene_type:complete
MSFKKANTNAGLSKEAKKAFDKKSKKDTKYIKGIAGDPLLEPIPGFIQTSTEKIIKNDNNAWIVLGRDRPGSLLTGYGGRGDTQAAAIDIVVGRMAANVIEYTANDQRVWTDPDFKKDAARIYISQKTDIDANFDLVAGNVGSSIAVNADEFAIVDNPNIPTPSTFSPEPRSGIALKADGVRIIAREGIKLVTGGDTYNSQGGTVRSVAGIDIIAGNDDSDLQPIVKGTNLRDAMIRLVDHVDSLAGIVDSLLMIQSSFNQAVTNHFHHSPFFGKMTTISPTVQSAGCKTMLDYLSQTKRSCGMFKTNLRSFQLTYLDELGDRYINSRSNHVN